MKDSDYEIRLATLAALGGDITQKYDSVYEIDLEILRLTEQGGGGGGTSYTAGNGITITGNVLASNTEGTLKTAINLSNGAPVNAMGIWTDNVIPAGTSVQSILEKLLNRELFPSAATLPNFTVSSNNVGNREYLSSYTPSAPSATKSNGNYNASYSSPSQPTPTGVTWTNESTTSQVISGFTGDGADKTVQLGTNKITYTYSKDYSAPSNMPLTNQNHPTQSTTKISTDGSDISAIWAAGSRTKTADVTVTGCYPCWHNAGAGIISDTFTKFSLTSGNILTFNDVPSEVVNQKHFSMTFPADRNVEFKIKDLQGNFVTYTGTYEIETISNYWNGISYKKLTTTGDFVGSNSYQFVLSKNLNA